jgi:hypothetical protein
MIASALPLIIYPGVLMAGVMGLAAPTSLTADPLKVAVARSFMILSMLYPVVWGIGFLAWAYGFVVEGQAIVWGNLLLCLALFAAWYFLSL